MTPLPNNFFAINIPPESYWHQIVHISAGQDVFQYYMKDGEKDVSMGLDLPKGTWEFICTAKDITEEQCKKIAKSHYSRIATFDATLGHHQTSSAKTTYMDYQYGHCTKKIALESFASLLRSLNLTGDIAIIKNQE